MRKGNKFVIASRDAIAIAFGRLGNKGPSRPYDNNPTNRTLKELWCLRRYIVTLGHNGLLQYPLRICASESPDFLLECQNGKFGLEITEATTRKVQECLEADPKAGIIHDPDLSDEKEEAEWRRRICEAVDKKVKKIRAPYWKQADGHDLLIYEGGLWAGARSAPSMPQKLAPFLKGGFPNGPLRHVSVLDGDDLWFDIAGRPRQFSVKSV